MESKQIRIDAEAPLKFSPLREAVLGFKFASASAPWDPTVPGLLWEKIKGEYPDKAAIKQATVNFSADGGATMPPASELARFSALDGGRMVHVGTDQVVVNYLSHYSTWGPFRDEALRVMNLYRDLHSSANGRQLAHISIRYVNSVGVSAPLRLQHYVKTTPLHPLLETSELQFHHQVSQYILQELQAYLNVTVMNALQRDKPILMLDLEMGTTSTEHIAGLNDHTLVDWLDAAHTRIKDAFRNSYTEEQFAEFQGGSDAS